MFYNRRELNILDNILLELIHCQYAGRVAATSRGSDSTGFAVDIVRNTNLLTYLGYLNAPMS